MMSTPYGLHFSLTTSKWFSVILHTHTHTQHTFQEAGTADQKFKHKKF
jgi:hypothetical protein